jgi:hypothetical protein
MTTVRTLRWMTSICALAAAAAHAAPVFEQTSAATISTGWTSHVAPGGGYQTFEDFKLASTAHINSVSWHGTYFDITGGSLNGGAVNTSSWKVEFWKGDASGPTSQLFSQTYDASKVSRNLVGSGNFATKPFDLYEFELDLDAAFEALAGETYWFSVVSEAGSFNPIFSWTNSDEPGNSLQHLVDGNGNVVTSMVRSGNRAFVLHAENTVPEPASLTLVASALLLGCAWSARRRRA